MYKENNTYILAIYDKIWRALTCCCYLFMYKNFKFYAINLNHFSADLLIFYKIRMSSILYRTHS